VKRAGHCVVRQRHRFERVRAICESHLWFFRNSSVEFFFIASDIRALLRHSTKYCDHTWWYTFSCTASQNALLYAIALMIFRLPTPTRASIVHPIGSIIVCTLPVPFSRLPFHQRVRLALAVIVQVACAETVAAAPQQSRRPLARNSAVIQKQSMFI
jgi:hypothetical protein